MNILVLVLALFLAGCAIFEQPSVPPEFVRAIAALQSPEMEEAIAAAKPGVPR